MRPIFSILTVEFVAALCAAQILACGASEGPATTAPGSASGQGGSGGMPAGGAAGTAPVGAAASGGGMGPAGSGGEAGAAGSGGSIEPVAGSGGSAGAGTAGAPEPVTCPATSTLEPGETTMRTAVGGRDGEMRTYIVHVPASYDGTKPVPLMINYHGLGGTGRGQRTTSGWAEVGDREGIITVFPNGLDTAWDIGNCCTYSEVDDVAFTRAIVSEVSAAACIDPNRVYASGLSMGGGMTHLLGCKAADVFAAIAPSAFDLAEESHLPCEPSRPISVFMHRGMTDFIVPYAGGPTPPPNGLPVTVTFLGAVATFDEWARINECAGEPTTVGDCRRHSQCENGVEVTLCHNLGHTEGPADVIWETLKKHGLSGPL